MAYDNGQFNNMRNDAIRRTREMYRNSMVNTSHYSQADNYRNDNNNKEDIQEISEIPEPEIHQENMPSGINKSRNHNHGKSAIPEGLGKIIGEGLDSEKLTIIALMIILAKEGADMKLILALGYILI